MRLAVLYGGAFFASGTVLTGFVYGLFWTGESTREAVPVPAGASIAYRRRGIDLHTIVISSAVALAVMVVISFVLGWVIAGRALRPLRTMMATARAISASNLHPRIGLDSPYEEFRELGATFDELFGRLDAGFQAQRHFVANASHELRTPLTAERALLQVTLADPDASVETLRSACEELLTLGAAQERLVESLLTLASSEQGVELWEPLDLGAITAEAIQVRQAEARQRDIHIAAALTEAPSAGDPRLVGSLVANLIDNAIRHNVTGGQVDVTTSRSGDGASIAVQNTGPVIPPGEVDRLFAPFQRLRGQRTRHSDGHGLGLAIVRAIATTHGAAMTARAPESGGLDVRVTFPLRHPAANSATSCTGPPSGLGGTSPRRTADRERPV
jgi:signal transduction histidine kinase